MKSVMGLAREDGVSFHEESDGSVTVLCAKDKKDMVESALVSVGLVSGEAAYEIAKFYEYNQELLKDAREYAKDEQAYIVDAS